MLTNISYFLFSKYFCLFKTLNYHIVEEINGELVGSKMWHFASPATPVIENGLLDLDCVCDRKPKQKHENEKPARFLDFFFWW